MTTLLEYNDDSFLAEHMAVICKCALTATLLMGVVGNFVNMLIFGKLNMRKESFGMLFLLSTVDLTILSIISAETLIDNMFLVDIRTSSRFFCKIDTFLVYFLTQTRNVISMGITIERAQIVSHLIDKNKTMRVVDPVAQQIVFNSRLSARQTFSTNLTITDGEAFRQNSSRESATTEVNQVGMLKTFQKKGAQSIPRFLMAYVIVLFWANSHFAVFLDLNVNASKTADVILGIKNLTDFSLGVNKSDKTKKLEELLDYYECAAAKNTFYEHFLVTYWVWFDMLAYFAIPLLAMTISFLFIFVRIRKLNENYSNFLGDETRKLNTRIYLKKIKQNKIVIVKLLVVNCYFFASILPYFVINIWEKGHYPLHSYFLKSFIDILLYSNNALNFFFYGISSQSYRLELLKTFHVYRKKIKKC